MNKARKYTLRRHLLTLGKEAGSRSEAATTRFVSLTVATCIFSLCLATLAMLHAAYTGKETRRETRTPVSQAQHIDAKEATLWLIGTDALKNERQYSVVYIAPHTVDAPLPPGVEEWPEPGEAVLSPALLEAGSDEGIRTRYGELAGTIGQNGLEDSGEWLAYVHPADGMKPEHSIESVIGFGPDDGELAHGLEPGMARFDDKPESWFQALASGLLLVPSVVLLFIAVRSGAYSRDRRGALVDALGGRRRDRMTIAIGEAVRPVVLGALSSVPFITAVMLVDVWVPYTGYLLSSADLRKYGWPALLAPFAAIAAATVLAAISDLLSGRRPQGNRPRSMRGARWQHRIAWLCPLAILLAIRGPELAGEDTESRAWIIWTSLAAVALTMPAAVTSVVTVLGRNLERTGRRKGWAGALIAGGRISSYPAATARLVAGVIIAILVFGQVVAWQALFGANDGRIQKALAGTSKSVAEIGPKGAVSTKETLDFLKSLPEGSEPIHLTNPSDPQTGPVTVRGTCPALRSLLLPCPHAEARIERVLDVRMQQLLTWNTAGGTYLKVVRAEQVEVAKEAALGEDGVFAVVSTHGGTPPVPVLKEASYEAFPRGAQVRFPGEEWLTERIPDRDQGRWVGLFGVIGIGVLVLAIGISGKSEFLRHGRALAPLTVVTGGYRVVRSSAAWAIFVPLSVAGVAGSVVSAWLARPISNSGTVYFIPITLMGSVTFMVLAVSLLMWVWATRIMGKQARHWQPRGE